MLYDPKDPYSTLNPYSMINGFFESQERLAEQRREQARETNKIFAEIDRARREEAEIRLYPASYETRSTSTRFSEELPASSHTWQGSRRGGARKFWIRLMFVLLFLAILSLSQ